MERYSRKQFLHKMLARGLHISKALISGPLSLDDAAPKHADDADKWFKAAMAAGIDPASVPAAELKSIVMRLQNEKIKKKNSPNERR